MVQKATSFLLLVNLNFNFHELEQSLSHFTSSLISKFGQTLDERSGDLPYPPCFLLLVNFGFHCYEKQMIVTLLPI